MLEILKRLFGKKKEKVYVPDPPGRTFNKIITSSYFGCEDINADDSRIAKAKQGKIDQISELELIPMFTRYSHRNTGTNRRVHQTEENDHHTEVSSVHVVFQKEVTAEKWNMTHVTEISFTVNRSNFDEFEKMSGVSLSDDFRDLTSYEKTTHYNGKERRKNKRDA